MPLHLLRALARCRSLARGGGGRHGCSVAFGRVEPRGGAAGADQGRRRAACVQQRKAQGEGGAQHGYSTSASFSFSFSDGWVVGGVNEILHVTPAMFLARGACALCGVSLSLLFLNQRAESAGFSLHPLLPPSLGQMGGGVPKSGEDSPGMAGLLRQCCAISPGKNRLTTPRATPPLPPLCPASARPPPFFPSSNPKH